MVNLCLQSYTFCLKFILYLVFTCLDPDLYSEYESGSTKVLNYAGLGIRSFRSNQISDCERFAQIAQDK